MTPNPAFQLAESEKQSALWGRFSQHLEERLAYLRSENDREVSETKTAALRGQIAEIKRLIELGKSRPDVKLPSV